jgi:hypothetical protein
VTLAGIETGLEGAGGVDVAQPAKARTRQREGDRKRGKLLILRGLRDKVTGFAGDGKGPGGDFLGERIFFAEFGILANKQRIR